ncbi:hypothetical protein EPJ79_01020 [Brachyspira aalborgi]|uniref:Uncharacterized protein n=1 Tax=Brachyspira aalborgi TaxID=29522 RepID=A0A5C8D2R2_9SPIR|nr:hypothetical protein [Brachyspira aalborgi]TXJ19770.1 hypothetical protein EPJ79_01020 [Brachyspira aalborgi]
MIFKNKKLFLKIYIPFVIIISIALIVLQILGSKKRIGYLTDFNLNIERTLKLNNLENIMTNYIIDDELDEEGIENYILTNENITNYVHQFRIRYYDKIFRNNDIYGVYPDLSNLPDYMENAEMDGNGSPYGNFISDKKTIEEEKIDNINYILKIKINIIRYVIYLILILLIIYTKIYFENIKIFFNGIITVIKIKSNVDIKLNLSIIMILGYLYLILPYMIFLITWVKYFISIPSLILVIIATYFTIKDTKKHYNISYNFNLFSLILLFIIITIWVIILGVGNICLPSGDTIYGRYAVFKDLIEFPFPIIYPENGYGFVYYFAHWIIPAIFGKIFNYNVANIILILWTSLPLFLTLILLSIYLNKIKTKQIFIIFLIFILFVPPSLIFHKEGNFGKGLLTVFATSYINIFNLFNQSPAIYLMSVLFLLQKNSFNFAFLGLSIMLYSPYATLGIIPFMIAKSIIEISADKNELKNIFSVSNILSSISIFPILLLYFSSTATKSDGLRFVLTDYPVLYLIELFMIKFGIIFILLFKYNKKNYLFYVSLFTLIAVSLIQYSGDHNFHRTNITALFFLSIFLTDYFINHFNENSLRKYLLLIIFMMGIFRGYIELDQIDFYLKQIKTFGKVNMEDMAVNKTFNTKNNSWQLRTITCQDIDNSIFFKYIAKDNKK